MTAFTQGWDGDFVIQPQKFIDKSPICNVKSEIVIA
jgi:hypothetical protein